MRILLIGDYPLDVSHSMPRFCRMLEEGLSANGHAVTLVRVRPCVGRLWPRGALGKWLGYVDKYLIFPLTLLRLRGQGWDVLHVCDHSYSMYLTWLRDAVTPSITCHDLLAVFAAEGRFRGVRPVSFTGKMQQRWIRKGLRGARRVACVSETTARDLRSIGCTGEIEVIHNALNRSFDPVNEVEMEAVRRRAGLASGERYLLHVGNNSWYKNRPGALRIFAALRKKEGFAAMKIVMAGRAWTPEMHRVAEESGLQGAAVELVDPRDVEIRALYAGAEALLFPSLAEGFGWPVLEAQACGCPVITSNREPMMEVAGNAAILVDPEDAEKAAAAIAGRWNELARMRGLGFANARRFDRAAMIERYESFFREGSAAR